MTAAQLPGVGWLRTHQVVPLLRGEPTSDAQGRAVTPLTAGEPLAAYVAEVEVGEKRIAGGIGENQIVVARLGHGSELEHIDRVRVPVHPDSRLVGDYVITRVQRTLVDLRVEMVRERSAEVPDAAV